MALRFHFGSLPSHTHVWMYVYVCVHEYVYVLQLHIKNAPNAQSPEDVCFASFFLDFFDADHIENLYRICYNIASVFCVSDILAVRPVGSQLPDQGSNPATAPPPPRRQWKAESQPLDFQGSPYLLYFEYFFLGTNFNSMFSTVFATDLLKH